MKSTFRFLVILTLSWSSAMRIIVYANDDWSYNENVKLWKKMNGSHCGSWRQSPIDLTNPTYWPVLQTPKLIENVRFSRGKYELINNGHSVTLLVPKKSWRVVYPTNITKKNSKTKKSPACIEVDGIHWHWGKQNNYGSEHWLNGKSFPAEGHLVSWNCDDYLNIDAAKNSPEGLYVFGFFYHLTDDKKNFNAYLEQVVKQFSNLTAKQNMAMMKDNDQITSINIPKVNISQLFPADLSKYYRYEGSLTTPPCTENVIWTLFHTPAFMSSKQIGYFRQLHFPNHKQMADNNRPAQKLNKNYSHIVKREIYSSFPIK